MAYGQPATCRRGGCGEPACAESTGAEGDAGWCARHRAEVRATRFRLAVSVSSGRASHRSTEPRPFVAKGGIA